VKENKGRPATMGLGESPLVAIAGLGLPGAARFPASPLDPETWRVLTAEVRRQRIEGLLAAAVSTGALPVTESQHEEIREAARSRAGVDLHLGRHLLTAASMLEAAKVGFRVLKGLAWSHAYYPDPSWRGTGDVDILVAAADWYTALEVLGDAGARRSVPELGVGFDRRFGKEATLVSVSGWEIDLHRTLVVGPFGLWTDTDDLFRGADTVTIGGVDIPVLGPNEAFLHACYNAALGDDPPRLIAVRDVCQLVLSNRLHPGAVAATARRWRGQSVVARAVSLARDVLGVDLGDHPVTGPFAGFRPSLKDRSLLASYRGPGRGYTSQLTAIVALPDSRERLAYLRALARPQPSYLAARGLPSPLAHVGHGARRMMARPRR
jgi:hypothetical protein